MNGSNPGLTAPLADGRVPVRHGVERLRSPSDTEEFWRGFDGAIENPLGVHAWFATAASTFAAGEPIEAYAAAADDGSRAVAAFVVARRARVRRCLQPGAEWLGEPFDLPHTGEAALRLLVDRLGRSRRALRLERLYADSPAWRLLQELARKRGRLEAVRDGQVPVLMLDPTRQEPEHRLNAGRRSDLRRARRRAEQIGAVETSIVAPTAAEVDEALQAAFAVEGSGWKTQQGSSVLTNDRYAAFFTAYCRHAAREGTLRIALLRIGGRVAASQVAIERGRAFWLLKIGYDPEFAACSPGMLLMYETIAYAASRSLDRFEMLGEMEPWIAVWNPVVRDTLTVTYYPNSVAGLAARAMDWLAPRLRPLLAGVRDRLAAPLLRRFVVGTKAADAIALAAQLEAEGHLATVGYWDGPRDPSEATADEYLEAIRLLRDARPRARHVSIKLTSIGFREDLLGRVAGQAAEADVALHCDALGPEDADRVRTMIERFAEKGVTLGYTIPARWRRSVADADWARSRNLEVRVVKGQWPDPEAADVDLRAAYLKVIDELAAGGARRLGIASHDVPLVKEAVQRLRAAGTPCHLELLYGLPARRSLAQAAALGQEVRFYLPYGTAYLPYTLGKLVRQPRLLWWFARGSLGFG